MAVLLHRLKAAARSTFNFMVEKPGLIVGAATLVAGGVYSTQIKPMRFHWAIESTLQAGTKPKLLPSSFYINRPEVIADVKDVICGSNKLFGIIIGPSGTGKSYATTLVCNKYPSWTLYHDIYEPRCTAEELAKTAGFITRPGFFDLLIERLFPIYSKKYFPAYQLSSMDHAKATSYVLDTVAERAAYLIEKKQLKVIPRFVIDGVDLVAKTEPDVFKVIVDRAKYWANRGVLKIVLVSSEGHVMPLIEATSACNRSAQIIEVLDIDNSKAVDYLVKNGIPPNLAKRLSTLAGNRMIYLNNIAIFYGVRKIMDEDLFIKSVEKYLRRFVQNALDETEFNDPPSHSIVKVLLRKGPMSPEQIAKALCDDKDKDSPDKEKIGKVIFALVAANLLRYQADKTVTWHSQIVHEAVLNNFS